MILYLLGEERRQVTTSLVPGVFREFLRDTRPAPEGGGVAHWSLPTSNS